MRWEVLKSDTIYRCRIFSVRRDHSRSLQSGQTHDFHVIEAGDWVNVIPLTADARVIMVRQFRHGIRDLTLEVPAGLIDDADASPSAAALRELREETGCVSDHILPLGVVHPNPALMNNRCHMFVAYEVEATSAPQYDPTEELAVETVRLDAIPGLIRSGVVSNALTLVAFQLLQLAQCEPVA
jgi:ADP-ribose pyrophosphatase